MYTICCSFPFDCGHFLFRSDSEICNTPHGHSWKADIVLSSEKLNNKNMVMDYLDLEKVVKEYIDRFDHAMLINTDSPHHEYFSKNCKRVIPFKSTDPTTEVIAETLYSFIGKEINKIDPNIELEKVRVWETNSAWAEFKK